MYVLTVARPLGALIASGQATLICSDSPFVPKPPQFLIRNHQVVLGRSDKTKDRFARAAEDGADLGTDLGDGTDYPGALLALVTVGAYRYITDWTAPDVLRTISTSIEGRTEAEVLHLYSPRRPQYTCRVLSIRPLPTHLGQLVIPDFDEDQTPSLRNWSDLAGIRAVQELLQEPIPLSAPRFL